MPDNAHITDAFNFPAPTPAQIKSNLDLRATHYNAQKVKATADGIPLLDKDLKPLGPKLRAAAWCKAAQEGTAVIEKLDGKITVYNHAGRDSPHIQVVCPRRDSGKALWRLAKGPLGDGVEGLILVPVRTIAVDKTVIPIRSVIFIQKARGVRVTLPSGETITHDGYFYAADVGGLISGNLIDVFVGVDDVNKFPGFIDGREGASFEAQVIDNPVIAQALAALHAG